MLRRPRLAAVVALASGLSLVVPTLVPAAVAAPVPDAATASSAASAWLAATAPTGVLTTGGLPDWGLTADGVLAHAAAGRGPGAGAVATDQLATHVADFASDPTGTGRNAGAIAKLLVVATVMGRDVSTFGGWNLRSELLARMTTGGAQAGRFRSVGVPDTTNGFSQALAIVGLLRSGGVPTEAVDFLVAQQCPGGAFRLFYLGDTCTAAAAADIDATALAVQALVAARSAGLAGLDAPITDALDWMEVAQGADGAFTAAGPSGVANANSTGLAGHALRTGGRTDAADRAAAWVRALQLDCGDAVTPATRGAIAYDSTAFDATLANGSIEDLYADQFVRATTEAVLALGAAPLGRLDGTTAGNTGTGFNCSSSTTSTAAPTTTGPLGSTTVPGSTTTSTLAGSSTTTVTSSAPASSTTTTTSTTIPVRISATSTPEVATEVAGISRTSGGGSASGSTGSLAVTGSAAGRRALGALLLVVSGALFVAARRARRA